MFLKTVLIIFPTSFPITNMLFGAFSSANSYGVGSSLGYSDGFGYVSGFRSGSLGADESLSLGVEVPSLLETELSDSAAGFLALVLPAAALILAHASGNSRTK